MKDIFSHTQYDNHNWADEIKNFSYSKTHIGWTTQETLQPRITAKTIKKNDGIFNPILQTYNNTKFDNELRSKERINQINAIIKNQDNQLKIEQTFNIINLADRLKGFEKDPNYPEMKDLIHSRKIIENHPKDYNIVSNLPISIHHFDRPEKRPTYQNSEPKRGRITYKFGQDRDYDIISTRYKRFNDEKNEVDKEIKKIQTAQIFYKYNDYNPIKGEYFNKSKEKEFQQKRKEEQKNWGVERFNNMPKCAKGKSDVYNLITLKIVDPKEMDRIIQEEKNRKQRYEIRYKIEDHYRNESMKNLDKIENRKNGKASYLRYKEEDNRQYDIIDLKDKPFKQHANIIKTGGVSDWQKIINGAGENNTFKKKKIYKDLYDYSEAGFSYDSYRNNRKKVLNTLPEIGQDRLFNQRLVKHTKYKSKEINGGEELNLPKDKNKFRMSKEKFFKDPPKNIQVDIIGNGKGVDEILPRKNLTIYAEGSGTMKLFGDNKEKNMRNLRRNLNFETGSK